MVKELLEEQHRAELLQGEQYEMQLPQEEQSKLVEDKPAADKPALSMLVESMPAQGELIKDRPALSMLVGRHASPGRAGGEQARGG